VPRRAILFDLDGTLIDSVPDLCASVNELLAEVGRRALTVPEVEQMIGEGAGMLVKRALLRTGRAERWRSLTGRFIEIYDARSATLTRPYPGAEAAMSALAVGHRLALCTNKPEQPTLRLLDHLGWTDRFEIIVGGDTLPERKPHPLPLLHIIERLQLQPAEVIMVGDSPADAGAAAAAGVDFVAVSWGYSRVPVAELPSIAVVDSMEALTATIRGESYK
jgi:phosphoglycolate phosphatase